MRVLTSVLALFLVLSPSASFAWGAKGHQSVGAIADENLTPNARTMVTSLIGMSLEQAGPWLDCVKDVKGSKGALHYVEDQNEFLIRILHHPSQRNDLSALSLQQS